VRKENYFVDPLLRDLLVTKFIVVGKGKFVLLQRYFKHIYIYIYIYFLRHTQQ